MSMKTEQLLFFFSMVSGVTVLENFKQTLPLTEKVSVQKLVIGFWTDNSNYKVKYWAAANLLFLMLDNDEG